MFKKKMPQYFLVLINIPLLKNYTIMFNIKRPRKNILLPI